MITEIKYFQKKFLGPKKLHVPDHIIYLKMTVLWLVAVAVVIFMYSSIPASRFLTGKKFPIIYSHNDLIIHIKSCNT